MQAFAWNCMNQALDAKGEAVAVKTVRADFAGLSVTRGRFCYDTSCRRANSENGPSARISSL
jgi:hypothetical protein